MQVEYHRLYGQLLRSFLLEWAMLNTFLIYIFITLLVGHSILFVGLYNPKGPCEEVQVKHTGKNTFTVNYYIRERSEYSLFVMWGQSHIPGSPFAIEVPIK